MPCTRRDTAVALPVSRALISWHSLYSGNGAQREIYFNPNIPYVASAGQVLSRRASRGRRSAMRGGSPRTARGLFRPLRDRANASVTSQPSPRPRRARYARERRPRQDETFAGDDVCPNRRTKSQRERRNRSSPGGPRVSRKLKIYL